MQKLEADKRLTFDRAVLGTEICVNIVTNLSEPNDQICMFNVLNNW